MRYIIHSRTCLLTKTPLEKKRRDLRNSRLCLQEIHYLNLKGLEILELSFELSFPYSSVNVLIANVSSSRKVRPTEQNTVNQKINSVDCRNVVYHNYVNHIQL